MTNSRSALLVLLLPALCSLAPGHRAGASPSISSISGAFVQGSRIAIAGKGFGDKSPADPITWDDFEQQTAGDGVAHARPRVGTPWTLLRTPPGTDPIFFDATRSISGAHSVKVSWLKQSINAFGWAGQGPYTQLYISYWRYQSGTYTPGVNNHKQFYLFGNSRQFPQFLNFIPASDTRWGFGNNQACNGGTYASENNLTDITYDASRDRWDRWEFWVKLNTVNKADGVVQQWINGALKNERMNYKHRCDGNSGEWTDFRLGNMFQGARAGPPDSLKEAWFDDVYIDTTLSRVEICDVSTWNLRVTSGARCAIQTSIAWSDGSIIVTANLGSLSPGQVAYGYVIDAAGTVNQRGHHVVLGASPDHMNQPSKPLRR